MLRKALLVFMFFSAVSVLANPRVPSVYSFADIKLTITDAARREIQESVDALHQSRTYFDKKLAKVNLYFPIIERVLREENVPDDFKYLVIQESALIADAVSVSNAVGFWQFKEVSAKEVGLRVDRYIDERMHITASTHAAAKYLKKNNFFFDNWLYALLAYNTGPGGAEAHVEKKYMGKKKMEINKGTHWYVKKFLAHKVAFENELGNDVTTGFTLFEYKDTENKSLDELSSSLNIDNQRMTDYNKWLLKGKIPSDKTYLAIVPVSKSDKVALKTLDKNYKEVTAAAVAAPTSKMLFTPTYTQASDFDFELNQGYPQVSTNSKNKVKVNGIPGFIAAEEDELNRVTVRHGLSINEFVRFNEMSSDEEIVPGKVYYLKAKKSKAKIHYHVVLPGEDAWAISQKYGIKVKKLLTKNRMREEKELEPGMVLWLRFIRPRTVPVEYRELPEVIEPVREDPKEAPVGELLVVEQIAKPDPPKQEIHNETAAQSQGESAQSEYFFEEVNEGTEYIDETSYIDVNNSTIEGSNTNDAGHTSEKIENEDIYHIVKSGETLFAISRMYDASIGELRQWNDIDDLNVLKVGQRILIRNEIVDSPIQADKVVELTPSTYTVKANETLYSIARKHGVSIDHLMELNDKQDFNVEEGELLIIKSSE